MDAVKRLEKRMKVNLINDCSHVGYTIYKELSRRGIEAKYSPVYCSSLDTHINHIHYAHFRKRLTLDVVHCHGSDIRRDNIPIPTEYNLTNAKKVLVSTPDLLPIAKKYNESAEWLPNPVDTEMFKSIEGIRPYNKLEWGKYKWPYWEMPYMYNNYKYFSDREGPQEGLTMMGLEALACGCTVLQGKIKWDKLPEWHRVEKVVDRLIEIYSTLD